MTTMTMTDGTVIEAPLLDTLIENVSDLEEDEYALARRQGLGASDSSILLGVNPYKQKSDLIIEKRSKIITEEERTIKMKDAVRKGFDLEPLILQKYVKLTGKVEPIKPTSMYRINATPCLTINFDGVALIRYIDVGLIGSTLPVSFTYF